MASYLYWGPHPNEMDGGAVVNYYLLKEQNKLRSRDIYWGIPKVPEELDPTVLPWVNYPIIPNLEEGIPQLMLQQRIPLINLFHIGRMDFDKVLDSIHEVGAKAVLHQTIHWPDDDCLKSERLKDFDCIVAPTKYAKDVFVNLAGLKPNKIEIIPHAVDLNRFYRRQTILKRRFRIKEHQKVILYSGRLSFWKGVQELVPIMRKLYDRYDCVFIIRGGSFGSREGRALHKIFDRLSYNNPNIIFLPEWQSPEFMEELYAITDILIFNSGHEGFGVPLIEAQAVGAIPITTALPNHIEICGHDGVTSKIIAATTEVGEVNDGTKVKVGSRDALFGAIQWVLENPEEATVMGGRGLENVKARFELSSVARLWLVLYDQLLEGHNMDEQLLERIV